MEFLRFGSSIPGSYWGTCSMCIIQNFKVDPDTKASIQLVSGDAGTALFGGKDHKELLFMGPTYADIFRERLRIGTFNSHDKPNHGFLAILTESLVRPGTVGAKWLKLLKEEGFEFLRTVDNSVYTGAGVIEPDNMNTFSSHKNYLFGLFRNIGTGAVEDQFTPPKEWTDLDQVVAEPWQVLPEGSGKHLTQQQRNFHHARWTERGPTKIMTEAEVVAAGAPVIMAGLRSKFPQQPKEVRERMEKDMAKVSGSKAGNGAFPAKVAS